MKFTLPLEITSYFSKYPPHVVKNLLVTTQGIFAAKSTNLNKVKDELGNILENQETTQPASNYKRLIRFFQIPDEEKKDLIKSLLCVGFCLLGLKGIRPKYITLDGTSWNLGNKKIHLITLAIVIKGVSIPICWEELDKKGTSNYKERKALFDKAFEWYNLKGMILLADREYIGEKWFKYLKDNGLGFVIRLKEKIYKSYVDDQRGQNCKNFGHQKWRQIGLKREAKKKRYRATGVSKQIEILGDRYTYVVFKNPKKGAEEELVYFLSTLKAKKKIVAAYPNRWTIECCFKNLKSNGFNLEELNFKQSTKIKMMMAIVSFLYILCIHQGLLEYRNMKKSDIKIYASGKTTLAVSVFKKGKAILAGKFYHLVSFIRYLTAILKGKSNPIWVHVQ